MWESAGSIASAVIAAAALLTVWIAAREAALRRAEVHLWADEVITAMQTLVVIANVDESLICYAKKVERSAEIAIKTSVLIERGRIFFKNKPYLGIGKEKPSAYRGLRPLILDKIVVAHQLACNWHEVDETTRVKFSLVAEDVTREFVSLIQAEVGRSRAAAARAAAGGDGVDVWELAEQLDPDRLTQRSASIG